MRSGLLPGEARRERDQLAERARTGQLPDGLAGAAEDPAGDGQDEPDLLHGVVEVDETYIGGVSPGKRGRGTDKVIIAIAVERLGLGEEVEAGQARPGADAGDPEHPAAHPGGVHHRRR